MTHDEKPHAETLEHTLADELALREDAEARAVSEHAVEVSALLQRGERDKARSYATKFARGLGSLARAEKVFGAMMAGEDEAARWARARMELVAFASALRDPGEAIEVQRALARARSETPGPRVGLLVIVLLRFRTMLPALREEIARRIQIRAVLVRRVLSSREEQYPEEYNLREPPLPDAWEARLLLNTLLARELCPSLPTLDFDPEPGEISQHAARAEQDEGWKTEYERESEELSNDLVSRAGIRNAAQALRYFGADRRATVQLADWASREGLLGGLSGTLFTDSLDQVIEAQRGLLRTLKELAKLEGQTKISEGSVGELLQWAVTEGVMDDATAQEISRGAL